MEFNPLKGEGLFEQIRKGLPISKENVDEFWKKYLKNEIEKGR